MTKSVFKKLVFSFLFLFWAGDAFRGGEFSMMTDTPVDEEGEGVIQRLNSAPPAPGITRVSTSDLVGNRNPIHRIAYVSTDVGSDPTNPDHLGFKIMPGFAGLPGLTARHVSLGNIGELPAELGTQNRANTVDGVVPVAGFEDAIKSGAGNAIGSADKLAAESEIGNVLAFGNELVTSALPAPKTIPLENIHGVGLDTTTIGSQLASSESTIGSQLEGARLVPEQSPQNQSAGQLLSTTAMHQQVTSEEDIPTPKSFEVDMNQLGVSSGLGVEHVPFESGEENLTDVSDDVNMASGMGNRDTITHNTITDRQPIQQCVQQCSQQCEDDGCCSSQILVKRCRDAISSICGGGPTSLCFPPPNSRCSTGIEQKRRTRDEIVGKDDHDRRHGGAESLESRKDEDYTTSSDEDSDAPLRRRGGCAYCCIPLCLYNPHDEDFYARYNDMMNEMQVLHLEDGSGVPGGRPLPKVAIAPKPIGMRMEDRPHNNECDVDRPHIERMEDHADNERRESDETGASAETGGSEMSGADSVIPSEFGPEDNPYHFVPSCCQRMQRVCGIGTCFGMGGSTGCCSSAQEEEVIYTADGHLSSDDGGSGRRKRGGRKGKKGSKGRHSGRGPVRLTSQHIPDDTDDDEQMLEGGAPISTGIAGMTPLFRTGRGDPYSLNDEEMKVALSTRELRDAWRGSRVQSTFQVDHIPLDNLLDEISGHLDQLARTTSVVFESGMGVKSGKMDPALAIPVEVQDRTASSLVREINYSILLSKRFLRWLSRRYDVEKKEGLAERINAEGRIGLEDMELVIMSIHPRTMEKPMAESQTRQKLVAHLMNKQSKRDLLPSYDVLKSYFRTPNLKDDIFARVWVKTMRLMQILEKFELAQIVWNLTKKAIKGTPAGQTFLSASDQNLVASSLAASSFAVSSLAASGLAASSAGKIAAINAESVVAQEILCRIGIFTNGKGGGQRQGGAGTANQHRGDMDVNVEEPDFKSPGDMLKQIHSLLLQSEVHSLMEVTFPTFGGVAGQAGAIIGSGMQATPAGGGLGSTGMPVTGHGGVTGSGGLSGGVAGEPIIRTSLSASGHMATGQTLVLGDMGPNTPVSGRSGQQSPQGSNPSQESQPSIKKGKSSFAQFKKALKTELVSLTNKQTDKLISIMMTSHKQLMSQMQLMQTGQAGGANMVNMNSIIENSSFQLLKSQLSSINIQIERVGSDIMVLDTKIDAVSQKVEKVYRKLEDVDKHVLELTEKVEKLEKNLDFVVKCEAGCLVGLGCVILGAFVL